MNANHTSNWIAGIALAGVFAAVLSWGGPALDSAAEAQQALNSAEQDYLFDHQQKKRLADMKAACPNSDSVMVDGQPVCLPRRGHKAFSGGQQP